MAVTAHRLAPGRPLDYLARDFWNYRILSVRLRYHAEEKVALKDVADEGKK